MSYLDELHNARKERLQRIEARQVPDDGIDLRRPKKTWRSFGILELPQEKSPIIVKPPPVVRRLPEPVEIYLPQPTWPPLPTICRAVCRYFNVSHVDLCSQRRTRDVIRPRQIAMYFARTLTLRSMPWIGRHLGGRDHTTVLHGYRRIKEFRDANNKIICDAISAIALTLADDGYDISALGIAAPDPLIPSQATAQPERENPAPQCTADSSRVCQPGANLAGEGAANLLVPGAPDIVGDSARKQAVAQAEWE